MLIPLFPIIILSMEDGEAGSPPAFHLGSAHYHRPSAPSVATAFLSYYTLIFREKSVPKTSYLLSEYDFLTLRCSFVLKLPSPLVANKIHQILTINTFSHTFFPPFFNISIWNFHSFIHLTSHSSPHPPSGNFKNKKPNSKFIPFSAFLIHFPVIIYIKNSIKLLLYLFFHWEPKMVLFFYLFQKKKENKKENVFLEF